MSSKQQYFNPDPIYLVRDFFYNMMKITLYTEHYYLICNMKGSSGLIPETELSHYYFSY